MKRLNRYEPGPSGTFRFQRVHTLDASQEAVGARASEAQAQIANLEAGRRPMHRLLAERLAPAYFPHDFAGQPALAVEKVWRAWFATVAAYGSPAMQRSAADLKAARDSWSPGPLFDAASPHAPAPAVALPAGFDVPKAVNQ